MPAAQAERAQAPAFLLPRLRAGALRLRGGGSHPRTPAGYLWTENGEQLPSFSVHKYPRVGPGGRSASRGVAQALRMKGRGGRVREGCALPALWSVLQAAHAAAAAFGKAGGAGGQVGHDGGARLVRQARPGRDFLYRAVASDADAFGGMDGAELDAGRLHLVALPDVILQGSTPRCIWPIRSRAPCRI